MMSCAAMKTGKCITGYESFDNVNKQYLINGCYSYSRQGELVLKDFFYYQYG
jgi:hypothetical protein